MIFIKQNLCRLTIMLFGCGTLAFSLLADSNFSKSKTLSNRQMAKVRGMRDCEDKTGSCGMGGFFREDVCDAIKTVTVRSQNTGETQVEYQQYLKSVLPTCQITSTYLQTDISVNPSYTTKEGADTEFDKKYKCLQQLYCKNTGLATPNSKKVTIQVSYFEQREECGPADNPLSYCLECAGYLFATAPDDMQPDIRKCKTNE